jgi:hypothetical protein
LIFSFKILNFSIMKTRLFISGLAFMALTTLAVAQSTGQAPSKTQNSTEKGVNFVDTNNNGICDNFENNNTGRCAGANNCCGQGRGQMTGQGQGMRNGSGMRQNRMGMGQGKGMGKNFVDADKNGVCDNLEAAAKK